MIIKQLAALAVLALTLSGCAPSQQGMLDTRIIMSPDEAALIRL
jgi:hypothetical protein